jgi:hypothetical protein
METVFHLVGKLSETEAMLRGSCEANILEL